MSSQINSRLLDSLSSSANDSPPQRTIRFPPNDFAGLNGWSCSRLHRWPVYRPHLRCLRRATANKRCIRHEQSVSSYIPVCSPPESLIYVALCYCTLLFHFVISLCSSCGLCVRPSLLVCVFILFIAFAEYDLHTEIAAAGIASTGPFGLPA